MLEMKATKKTPYYDLGRFSRRITAANEEAQLWFDRGLVWSYGFNHQASVDCFESAIEADPQCTMAYWGLAYALGPNYNKPWEVFDEEDLRKTLRRAHHAAAEANTRTGLATPVEQALSSAILSRYPQEQAVLDYSKWNQDYADAMEAVYRQYPQDLDVAALFADALMNLSPWALWDISTGLPTKGARTLEVKDVLDQALASPNGNDHPGLLHLYIHLMEMSNTPEAAMPVANRLRSLVPDAGHLNHMPTHLDLLCGGYRQAIASNSKAIEADAKYLAEAGPLNFYTLYRCHNYHFKVYAAMFAGQCRTALETCAQLVVSLPEELLRVQSPPMADWLEAFYSLSLHVMVRFGLWTDILEYQPPPDQTLFCVTTAMTHYARGVAYAATGMIQDAEGELANFAGAMKRVPRSRTLFNNACVDILAIGGAMLEGELEYRKGNIDKAFQNLRRAIKLDDTLPYDEPWGWMQPTRHAYGALLLEQNRVEEAADVFKADLGLDNTLPRALHHPNNVWALHGYHECLQRLGRTPEAETIDQQLTLAKAIADVSIVSSCYCRRTFHSVNSADTTCCDQTID